TEIGLLENLCGRVFAGISEDYKPEVLGYDAVHLRCDCSKERMEQALISLGKKELKEIIQTDGRAELGCHFCGNKYEFTKAELE
ncbi:MAG: Hsp33 family molecular chaperone HslO, partial [Anaerovoracaceae bacterium]